MAWNTITTDDVQKKLSAAEFSAITTASLPSGVTGAQVVAEEITNAIAEVRGYISGYRANILGESGTVPDELRETALVLIRHRIFTRLPKMKSLLDELRQKEYEEAMRKLRDVAAGRFALVPPTAAAADDEQAAAGGVTVVTKSKRWASRDKLGGLF